MVVLGDPATNAGVAPVDGTAGLKVDLGADNDVTITSGTVTTITDVVHIDDNGGNISIDDGGNSITVDGTVAATQSGTWNITNVSGITSQVVPATGQTNLGAAVDAAANAAKTGVLAIAVRDDALSTLTPVDNDYTELRVDSTGAQWTHVTAIDADVSIDDGGNSITVDGTVTANLGATDNAVLDSIDAAVNGTLDVNIVSGAGSGGTAAADDADFTAGTTNGTPAMGVYESTPTSVTDGDLGTVGITQGRRLKTSSTIDAAIPAGTNNIGDVDILSIAAGDNNIGNVDIASIAAGDNNIGNVDLASAIPAGTNNIGDVDIFSNTAKDGSGTRYQPLVDSDGHLQIDVLSGGTAGTEYTEDAAAAANPVGGVQMLVRSDTPASEVTANGDNVAQRGTTYGAAYVTILDGSGNIVGGSTQYTEDAASAGGEQLTLMGAVRRDTAASSATTDGDYATLNTDSSGRLHVNVGNTVAVTQSGTWDEVGINDSGNSITVDNGGTFAVQAAQSGTWTVQPGNTANTTPWLTTDTPATSGGLSIFRSLDLDETEEEVKATAGQVFSCWVTNTATSTRWLKFYNATAANVTVGTTTPVITIGIPGNTSDDISGSFGADKGIAFGTAITVAATTGLADNDTGAPGANEVLVNIFYK